MPEAPFGLPPVTVVGASDLLVGGAVSGARAGETVQLRIDQIIALDHTASPVQPSGVAAVQPLGAYLSVDASAAAAGTSPTTATPLAAARTIFVAVNPGGGARLLNDPVGTVRTVTNLDTVDLTVWPNDGAGINQYAPDSPVAVPPNNTVVFTRRSATIWAAS